MKTKKILFSWAILLTILLSTSRVEAQKKDISSQVTLANEFYHEKNYQAAADIFEKAWPNFLSGYKSSVGKERFAKITNKVMIIESRGRYAKVV